MDPKDTKNSNDPYADWEEVYEEATADPTEYNDGNVPKGTHIVE